MKPPDLGLDLQMLEALIVAGNLARCRDLLQTYNPRTIGNEYREKLAELSIRSSSPLRALKFLHCLLQKPDYGAQDEVPASVKILYSRALYQLGASDEAIEILKSVDPVKEPEVLFWMACACMYAWNYEEAQKYLNLYSKTGHGNQYRKHIVEVNKVACMINSENYHQALSLITATKLSCKENGFNLLLGNLSELEAQVYIFTKDYKNAELQLCQASELLKNQGALYELYVNKWTAVLKMFQSVNPKENSLEVIREQARELSHWSTLRECDFFEAVILQNQELLKKVYWGSPSAHYRKRIKKMAQPGFQLTKEFNLRFSAMQSEHYFFFDPAVKGNGYSALSENKTLFTLFCALTEDFYQPQTLTALFKKVYADEKFNPFTSVNRVMRLLVRLNLWLKEAKVPLQVRIKKSEFILVASGNVDIRIRRAHKTQDGNSEIKISNLISLLRNKTCSTREVAQQMEISAAGAQRLLNEALNSGRVIRIGNGRSSLYRAVSGRKERAAA